MTKVEMVATKMNMLGAMYDIVGQDDEAFTRWVMDFPDSPTEEDLREMVEDECDWVMACTLFGALVKQFRLG